MTDHNDNFSEYRRLLMHELERLTAGVESVNGRVSNSAQELHTKIDQTRHALENEFRSLHADVVMLKTRATLWGSAAGTIFGAIVGGVVSAIVASMG